MQTKSPRNIIKAVSPLKLRVALGSLYGNTKLEMVRLSRRVAGKSGTLQFSPGLPHHGSAISKLCAELGWKVSRYQGSGKATVVFWPGSEEVFPKQPAGWINSRLVDINKDTVGAAFDRAFGYSYDVDPETATGSYVRKSIGNAKHDGTVLTEPSRPAPGYVYQRLIANVVDDQAEDLRLVYMRGALDFLYVKQRPISARFKNKNSSVRMAETASLLSPEEIKAIGVMCDDLGMEYGEIDALRDRNDGRLYVVDMNRTPNGPPKELSPDQKKEAVRRMSGVFAERFGAT